MTTGHLQMGAPLPPSSSHPQYEVPTQKMDKQRSTHMEEDEVNIIVQFFYTNLLDSRYKERHVILQSVEID